MSLQVSLSEPKLHQPDNFQFDSVPDSHDWCDLYDHPIVEPIGLDSIPIIELTDPKLIEKIGKACEEWGVFLIKNHGIDTELVNKFGLQIRRLFALPMEVKLKVAKADGGNSGYGGIPISHFFPKFMWSEGFTIGGSPLDHAQKLWPDDYSSFCEVIEEYKKAAKSLGNKLLHAMLLSLGLSEEEIKANPTVDTSKISTSLHLNSYPACPDPNRALGLAPHTDSGYVTVLYHNGISGLQVLKQKDDIGPTRWVTVPAVPDTFVINIGDLMHVLSNGRFHSVVHRGFVNKTYQRLSAGYFLGPPKDVKVGPLSELTEPKEDPIYRPVTWPEFQKLRGVFYDKALQQIKISGN